MQWSRSQLRQRLFLYHARSFASYESVLIRCFSAGVSSDSGGGGSSVAAMVLGFCFFDFEVVLWLECCCTGQGIFKS